MRPLSVLVGILAGLVGSGCPASPPTPADIPCNGVDEDGDGVDTCAELPEGAADALDLAARLLEVDCAGWSELLDAALAPVASDGDCPTVSTAPTGPVWDDRTECSDVGVGVECTRTGSAQTTTWSGGCERGTESVSGSVVRGEGAALEVHAAESSTTRLHTRGSIFASDGLELSSGDAAPHYRISGAGERTEVVRDRQDDEDPEVSTRDSCTLTLDLGTDEAVDPLPEGGGALDVAATDVRVVAETEGGVLISRDGSARVVLPGVGAGSWADIAWRRRSENSAEDDSTQDTVDITAVDVASGATRWTVRLEVDSFVEPCATLTVDGAPAGPKCDWAVPY